MATFTRLELRNYVTDTDDFSSARNFSLENNVSTTAYFNIEGVRYWNGTQHVYKDVFNTASITSLNNCSVVTGSVQAAFIIDPNATATFTFTPSATIAKEDIQFVASNTLVFSTGDNTASGSAFGVDLDTNA